MNDVLGTVKSIPTTEAAVLLQDHPVQTIVSGIPVHSKSAHDYTDPAEVETKVVGYCKLFNLAKEEERTAYADLLSELAAKDNFSVHFEEKTTNQAGELLIYISYVEYIKLQIK